MHQGFAKIFVPFEASLLEGVYSMGLVVCTLEIVSVLGMDFPSQPLKSPGSYLQQLPKSHTFRQMLGCHPLGVLMPQEFQPLRMLQHLEVEGSHSFFRALAGRIFSFPKAESAVHVTTRQA